MDVMDTYLHPRNGSYSAIDLPVCDPSLLLDFSWSVDDDLCGSDLCFLPDRGKFLDINSIMLTGLYLNNCVKRTKN